MEEMAALMLEHGYEKVIPQPPNSITAAQFARDSGMHPSSVSIRFHALIKQGKLEYLGKGQNGEKYYRIKK